MDIVIEKPKFNKLKKLFESSLIRGEDVIKLRKILSNPNHIVLIAKKNKQLCGYIHAKNFKNIAFIENIVLLEQFQGRGIAKKLYENLLKIIKRKRIKRIKLFIYSTRKKAILFWRKKGFLIISKTKDNAGKKLLIMEKEIKAPPSN